MTAPDRQPAAAPPLAFSEFVPLIAALMALGSLGIDSMLPALPAIGSSLGVASENERQLIVTAFLILFWWLSPKVFRLLCVELNALGALFARWFSSRPPRRFQVPALAASAASIRDLVDILRDRVEDLPGRHAAMLSEKLNAPSPPTGVKCAATKHIGMRNSIGYLREDRTLLRKSVYTSIAPFHLNNVEAGAYAQDRWQPRTGLLVEPGVRFDWDEIIRRPLVSPRIAAVYSPPGAGGSTKISAGVGVERTFPFSSPALDKVELVNVGKVRRSKLYFLRNLSGKAAKIESELASASTAAAE